MFSKKMAMVILVIVLVLLNLTIITVTSKQELQASGAGRFSIHLLAPMQKGITNVIRSVRGGWKHYFMLVSVSMENDALKKELNLAYETINHGREIELMNLRLRRFLDFREKTELKMIAAEVTGKDASAWFHTIIIDKGESDGVEKGLPVVVPEGIVGQVIEVSKSYSKVLLITDRNSAVDALAQRSRARGIIEGKSNGQCILNYALRKHELEVGDVIVSSGLDGVFPKGLRLGHVSEIKDRNYMIFQDVVMNPFVDFEKLEEVLIIMNPKTEIDAGSS